MFEKFRSLILGVSLIVVLLGLGAFFLVQIGGGDKLFGGRDATLPPIDFATLDYKTDDVGFLLCSPDLCTRAEADGNSELFAIDAQKLRTVIADFADHMPTVSTLRFDLMNSQFDFTERLPGERYPSVVSVRISEDTPLSSKLAIYSFQPVGDSKSADHQERVVRWINLIRARLQG